MPFRRVLFLNSGYCTQFAYLVGRPSWGWTRFYAVFVYLEHPKHGAALIDTGYSPWFFSATRRLPQRLYRWATPVHLDARQDARAILSARSLATQPIEQVFVSHFHGDHVAGLRHFPSARFVYRPEPLQSLLSESAFRQVRHGFLKDLLPDDFAARGIEIAEPVFQPGVGALREFMVHDYWGDGDLLLVDLPGHAIGQTGYVIRTESERIFYVVDACWDMEAMLAGRVLPRLTRRLQHSYLEYIATQEKLRRLAQTNEFRMLACHCPRTQANVSQPED